MLWGGRWRDVTIVAGSNADGASHAAGATPASTAEASEIGPPRCGLLHRRSRPGPKGAALAGRPWSCGQSRAAHGHQSLSGAELAWRTSLVRHLESDLPQTHQTQPSHPLRDLVLAPDACAWSK